MTKYEAIYNLLEKKVEQGVITESEATELNILAYEKYVMTEGKKDDDLEMIDNLRSKIDSGDAKLSKDAIEEKRKQQKEQVKSDNEKYSFIFDKNLELEDKISRFIAIEYDKNIPTANISNYIYKNLNEILDE